MKTCIRCTRLKCFSIKAGESQPRAPVQNDDLWTRAHAPLEIADDKQNTNILPRFPGPSEHSGPRVFCPHPPAPPPSRRSCFQLLFYLKYPKKIPM